MQFHQYSIEELFSLCESEPGGLGSEQARHRLSVHGPNELGTSTSVPWWRVLLQQFVDFMIIILLLAACISWFLGDEIDAIVIISIVVINAAVGFIQEFQAERAMEALQKMAAHSARVLRDGYVQEIAASELVVGDVIVLEAGNIIPADARVLESSSVRVEEAALTGESMAVFKNHERLPEEGVALGDRSNMLFKGTAMSNGSARALVVAIGMQTELGRIAAMLQQENDQKTPLQQRLARFGKWLAVAVMVICAVVFGFGVLRGEDPFVMLLTSISLAVAAIPEALPAVVTIALSMSAKRMVRRQSLVRRLPAVETLGSVTYICTDKTGTLTKQQMSVRGISTPSKRYLRDDWSDLSFRELLDPDLVRVLCLSNDVALQSDGTLLGESTEMALYKAAVEFGLDREQESGMFPRIRTLPFDSERKRMSTLHRDPFGNVLVYCKGAPELLLERCTSLRGAGLIDEATRQTLLAEFQDLAGQGLRVLACATRIGSDELLDIGTDDVESTLEYLGCVGLIDPPRPEVFEAVQRCKAASIVPLMITGDHPLTALAIAKELGIADDAHSRVINGRELELMSHDDLLKSVHEVRVYARVAPEQKLRIVRALQDLGEFVAMTGDGVNDAPALKMANIGIAMGINGTEVSKEAAAMILLDDNFATIVNAVEEGRRVYDNIRKFIKYIMTSNSGEIWTIFLAPFLGLPIPLLPVHILWINLVTDGLPGLALASEPAAANTMQRAPRAPSESIFAHGLGLHIVWVGVLLGIVPLVTQYAALYLHDSHWQTMVFTVLCFSQMGHVLAIRSDEPFWKSRIGNNPLLIVAIVSTVALQLLTIYVPFFQNIFHTEALSLLELGLACAASSVVFLAVEAEKLMRRQRSRDAAA